MVNLSAVTIAAWNADVAPLPRRRREEFSDGKQLSERLPRSGVRVSTVVLRHQVRPVSKKIFRVHRYE